MTNEEYKAKVEPVLRELSTEIMAVSVAFNNLLTVLKEDVKRTVSETADSTSEQNVRAEAGQAAVQSQHNAETETPEAVAPQQKITLEDIRAVLTEKTQDGLTSKIKDLLHEFGAAKLSRVPEEKYPELMAAAKALK